MALRHLAPLLLLAAAAAAPAATLQFTITGADGKPAADTVVLVTPTSPFTMPPPPEPALLVQKDSRFVPYVTVVPLGATVRFVNRDSYDHHVRSQPGGPLGSVAPAKQFEFRLARARGNVEASAELKADVAGTVLLGCHLHNAMRGHLFISTTPWFAITDDNGRASVAGLPEGQVDLRVWHPDQLIEQPALRQQLAGTGNLETRLNFTPRKRPPPRPQPKGEYDF
ncbi:MAG: plastocyanin [Rubrivivax sp.]